MNDKMRQLLRDDFLSFARKAIRKLDGTRISSDPYVEYLATELMRFAGGGIKRLLLNLPPRCLKTHLASILLPAWILGHDPQTKIMVLACSAELAEKIARSIRSILSADWYREIFPTCLKKGHGKAMHFETTDGGSVFAASINGNFTGHGADIIIIDDPHQISDAGRPQALAATIDIFDTVVKSRLNNRKTGRLLVIAHRISDKDLSAHLLANGKWEHVVLPLMATRDQTYKTAYGPWHRREGELLRPDAEDEDDIALLKKTLVNPGFDLLYQQDCDGQARLPICADHFLTSARGDYWRLPRVLSVDAGTADDSDASFSVIQAWAFDDRNLYLLDQWRAQCEFDELERNVRLFNRSHRPMVILIENAANGPALISRIKRKRKLRRLVMPITPRGSKKARLNRHIDKIHDGRVHLLEDADFAAEFVAEFVAFPHGKHADQVDAFTQAADWIDENRVHADKPRSASPFVHMVARGNSSWGQQTSTTNKPGQPGVCVGRANSWYKGSFIMVR